MGIRELDMARVFVILVLASAAFAAADHTPDALIELGTGFTGVVSSRNFEGEGKELKGIDQALSLDPGVSSNDPLAKVDDNDYDDGNAGSAAKTSEVEALELSDLEAKLSSTDNKPQQDTAKHSGHKHEVMDITALEAKLDGIDATKPTHTKSETKTHSHSARAQEDAKSDRARDQSKSKRHSVKAHGKHSQISCAHADDEECNPEHCLCKTPKVAAPKVAAPKVAVPKVAAPKKQPESAELILKKLKLASQRFTASKSAKQFATKNSEGHKVDKVTDAKPTAADILSKLRSVSKRFKKVV